MTARVCPSSSPPPPGQAQPASRPVPDGPLLADGGSEQPPPTCQVVKRSSREAKGQSGDRRAHAALTSAAALAPACAPWPCSRLSRALACSSPPATPETPAKAAPAMRLHGLVPGEGPLPSQIACPRANSALPLAKPIPQAPESRRGPEGSGSPPALGLNNSDKLGPAWLVLAWTPGEGQKRTSRALRGEKHPLRVLRLLRSVVPTYILGVAGSPALPETQPMRAPQPGGLGTQCPGETAARAPVQTLGTQLSPRPESTMGRKGTGSAPHGSRFPQQLSVHPK